MAPKKTLIIGCRGQLGRALQVDFPGADLVDLRRARRHRRRGRGRLAVARVRPGAQRRRLHRGRRRRDARGRRTAWAANAGAPATLARLSREHGFTLVHYSSEYVFDGTADEHTEDEPLSPLGVYAQTKAAGDIAVATAPRHYLLRTSWVIGDGNNFVRTMQRLADNGVSPSVVADQVGRLTFTTELSRATRHLLDAGAAYGTYNLSNGGPVMSWAEIARAVFRLAGRDDADVTVDDDGGVLRRQAGGVTAPAQQRDEPGQDRGDRVRPGGRQVALERYLSAAG